METVRILILGDVMGAPGRMMLQKHLPVLKQEFHIDGVIVNGENSASDGRGITSRIMRFFKHIGVDVVTGGNHSFQKKDIYPYLQEHKDLLRPANFPSACPGTGVTTFKINETVIGVINVQGRVFMREHVGCPFKAVETALTFLKTQTNCIIVDVHAESTSEKIGLAFNFDGKVSAVFGTHTHVQTADERILPGGTAFISDVGMAGALNSMIGMKKENIIYNMMTQLPVRFEVETEGPFFMTGIWVEIDKKTGKALKIERVKVVDQDLIIQNSEQD
ncbi:MAG: TIGR00282 family metallophosphoesterase [Candidatus Babeliaceae bacterium]